MTYRVDGVDHEVGGRNGLSSTIDGVIVLVGESDLASGIGVVHRVEDNRLGSMKWDMRVRLSKKFA
jgi:hypothetical protein